MYFGANSSISGMGRFPGFSISMWSLDKWWNPPVNGHPRSLSARSNAQNRLLLHASARFLDESSGNLAQHPGAQTAQARQFPHSGGSQATDPGFRCLLQSDYGPSVQVDVSRHLRGKRFLACSSRKMIPKQMTLKARMQTHDPWKGGSEIGRA